MNHKLKLSTLIPILFAVCPSGLKFLEHHAGGLTALITMMKWADIENDCTCFCDSTGSHCSPVIWSTKQRSYTLHRAHEKEPDVRGAWKGWIICGSGKKGKCYVI